jgi:hypothetical protein
MCKKSYTKKDTAASIGNFLLKVDRVQSLKKGNEEYQSDRLTFRHKTAKFKAICGQL